MGSLQGQRFVVVGLGKSGKGAVELLLSRGASVTVIDEKPDSKDAKALEPRGVTVHLGGFPPKFWEGVKAVVVSPGVPLSKPALVEARNAGATLYGEVELAWRCLPEGAGPLLGITGTNGKSTTTALLGELVTKAGKDAFVGGNLGRAFTEACAHRYETHVVELSSFQLEGCVDASFLGAAILNLQPDHLDRYASQADYGAAKARIFAKQPKHGFAVVNADDADVVKLSAAAHVPVYGFTMDANADAKRFKGLAVGQGTGFRFTFGDRESFTVTNRSLRGAHNVQNAMAAALMARLGGLSAKDIQQGLDSYPGLAHRMEFVRELDGVEYLNDSKATNVDSSLVAMKALAGRVWLIAGGKGKGAPYAPLVEAARGKLKGVLTIGKDAPTIEAAFQGEAPVLPCGTLDVAVRTARQKATAGDVVLLSPACASYDQFDHFEHRGDTFKALVKAL
jgi:UDP-N-acetylmuramoylalanine--D-glutamate ligase